MSEQTMIARVAEIIGEYADPDSQETTMDAARRVLTAMREPTDGMKLAGAFCEPFMTDAGKKPFTPGQIIAHSCYEAMIDAALAEEG
jgi:hypothetical protein